MTKYILLITLFLFTGCITTTPIAGPNNKKMWSLECKGTVFAGTSCYQEANKVCPNGYTIVDSNKANAGDMLLLIECK